jgi:hypothetical protein
MMDLSIVIPTYNEKDNVLSLFYKINSEFKKNKIDGEIVKVIVAPYEFVNQRTGEVMQLQHSYAYRPKDSQDLVGHTQVQELSMA